MTGKKEVGGVVWYELLRFRCSNPSSVYNLINYMVTRARKGIQILNPLRDYEVKR